MSSGKSVRLSGLDSWVGYGGRARAFAGSGGGGGIVKRGLGDVKANTLAVATASAKVLNSATGVTFPSMSIAPPMTTTSLTFKKVSTSSAAASAKFVKGPTATIVIVSRGFSLRIRRISLCATFFEGMKDNSDEGGSAFAAPSRLNSSLQASDGER